MTDKKGPPEKTENTEGNQSILEDQIANLGEQLKVDTNNLEFAEKELARISRAEGNALRSQGVDITKLVQDGGTINGIMDKVYKMNNPDLTRIQNSVTKSKQVVDACRQKLTDVSIKIKVLQREVSENNNNDLAKSVFDGVNDWRKAQLNAEGKFDRLKELILIASASDLHYPQRAKALGFPIAFQVILESQLTPPQHGQINSMIAAGNAQLIRGYDELIFPERYDRTLTAGRIRGYE